MAKRNTKPQRIHPKLIEDMEKILDTRVRMGLIKRKEASMPKATELLTRTQGYKMSLEELRIKKERRKNGQ